MGKGMGSAPQTEFHYDAYGNVTAQFELHGREFGSTGNWVWYADVNSYDARNRLISTKQKDLKWVNYNLSGGHGPGVEYQLYDVAGQSVGTIDAGGNAAYFEYDAADALSANGWPTLTAAEANSRRLRFVITTRPAMSSPQSILSEVRPNSNTTRSTVCGRRLLRFFTKS